MAIEIVPYTAEHIQNVRDFNARMAAGGEGDYQLPKDLAQFEGSAGGPLPWEGWLALVDGTVRGGYLLRRQEFCFGTDIASIAFYNLSPSEGSIDKSFAPVSMKMLTSLMSREKLVFALGMGGVTKRLPQFLKALGWKLHEIPFLFLAVHPGAVLRNIAAIRTTPARRLAANLAAWSGAATLGLGALQAWKRLSARRTQRAGRAEVVSAFGDWADELWARTSSQFAMIGVRDQAALNALYPASMPRLSRLRIWSGEAIAGWAVVLNTKMKNHKQFGNLHVGTIADCLSAPEQAPLIVAAAERYLKGKGVDIIVSNQSHRMWTDALLERGYRLGPSNYVIAMTKGLAAKLEPLEANLSKIHITRGDGDGPIHL